jgi:adenosine deaminase
MREMNNKGSHSARLLLSIDRGLGVIDDKQACEVVALVLEFIPSGLVAGLDIGGNPLKGSLSTFKGQLQEARAANVPITIHCGEVENDHDMNFVLKFKPERLGHALLMKQHQFENILDSRIPVEICPTSNKMTLCLECLAHHPIAKHLINGNHPISINTDDSGVFNTDSSTEYFTFACAMGIGQSKIAHLAIASMAHSFLHDEPLKKRIVDIMQRENYRLLWLDFFNLI